MNFQTILAKHRKLSFSEKDKGTRFEQLMRGFLLTNPIYAERFEKVWLWNEFPYRDQFGGQDTGIDLVALAKDGEYWAVQCKCYQEDTQIDKKQVDSFLATSSREFLTEDGKKNRFSYRLWISTSNKWGTNAEEALHNQNPPVSRINLFDLESAPVDWETLDTGIFGVKARLAKKNIRPHQKVAIDKVHEHFKAADRGKLIMACGTGKTYTSLKIAENETIGKGRILVLVPSISLMGQTLTEWFYDAHTPINAICICSDAEVSKKKSNAEDIDTTSVVNLALPASTDVDNILRQFKHIEKFNKGGLTVVFSTYQSIDVISKAQSKLNFVFDLIICDEAHRTTGVTLAGEDESAFVKVHDNNFLPAKKRLYMTATPRIFSDDSKSKANIHEAVLCSMDDENLYGKEIHRLGFGQAVEEGLLADYKVLVLTLNDQDISPSVQQMVSDEEHTINADDASKLIGCINALSKQIIGDEGIIKETDPLPMKRAVAFCQKISVSKEISNYFNEVSEKYIADLPDEKQETILNVTARHIDGTMNATARDNLLGWLKNESDECRILTNVRCLSEGVDVPSLDAVMFLAARNSQIDVVQSVGRVMRLSEGKKYGYIIIPIVIPSGIPPEEALNDNTRYKVVWTVLNALRAHDDRFNATINKIELNKKKPANILVGRPDTIFDKNGNPVSVDTRNATDATVQTRLQIQFEELQSVVFARMVNKVGDREYLDQWAKSVAEIADKQIGRLNTLVEDVDVKDTFAEFLTGLRDNIHPEITRDEAIEMLSQHMITKPVFDALFENYSFADNNPISQSMQKMIDLLEAQALDKDTQALEPFYQSVKKRVSDIDNTEGRQRVITELYEKFFKIAFPKMAEQLGIVYTPVEVVDFIVRSVDDILKTEFKRSLTDENVHILDPFTGTGTFVTRLLQSGLIKPKDLDRKYTREIHANEIVLLAYYIAAVNIENAYHDVVNNKREYQSFPGICLTDTFQLGEAKEGEYLLSEFFPQNSEQVNNQRKKPITVIIGNPPYSAGQTSANDNAQNRSYPKLEKKIEETYARGSSATNKNSLYDSYIKAFRWSSDRLDTQNGGIICFVSNGGWIDGNAMEGFRKSLECEFNRIYVFNLRGNQRTSGEVSKREGGKIFGSGSRAQVAITLLVKNPRAKEKKSVISYHDIGDYLRREEKLSLIKKFGSISNPEMHWELIHPNEEGDWINLRNAAFGKYPPIGDKMGPQAHTSYFVPVYSRGLESGRDAWCYNSNRRALIKNIGDSITFYNDQIEGYASAKSGNPRITAKDFVLFDSTKFSWMERQISDISNLKKYIFDPLSVQIGVYRPFFKQILYFNRQMNNRVASFPQIFPTPSHKNLVICVSGVGVTKEFTTLITNIIPDLELVGKSQCFPLYYYEQVSDKKKRDVHSSQTQFTIDEGESSINYCRRDGISDFILQSAESRYGKDAGVTKEEIFYYVYGILHSPEYRTTYSNDLKKMLPRIPLVDNIQDFRAFCKAGRKLADLHLNYEKIPPYSDLKVTGTEREDFKVQKMKPPKKGQKDTIIYNSKITISNVPEKAYRYVINGKSAIEWIMERYQVTIHPDSKIKNDPNDWAKEVGNPRYILDLLLSVINVSIQTVDIVERLPKLKFDGKN